MCNDVFSVEKEKKSLFIVFCGNELVQGRLHSSQVVVKNRHIGMIGAIDSNRHGNCLVKGPLGLFQLI